ncbi:MAG: hypothetical protein KDB00_06580, partial [Planctomycetales bacterium]|nr:hypothetical protein [Planctomycetales bacterium]
MNAWFFDLSSALILPKDVDRIGWTLVHSIWQFTLLAIASLIIGHLLRHRSAAARYVTYTAVLILMVVVSAATWALMTPSAPSETGRRGAENVVAVMSSSQAPIDRMTVQAPGQG